MIVLVCGGRTFDGIKLVFGVLDQIHAQEGIEVVVQGGANGADMLAREWAHENGVDVIRILHGAQDIDNLFAEEEA